MLSLRWDAQQKEGDHEEHEEHGANFFKEEQLAR